MHFIRGGLGQGERTTLRGGDPLYLQGRGKKHLARFTSPPYDRGEVKVIGPCPPKGSPLRALIRATVCMREGHLECDDEKTKEVKREISWAIRETTAR